jgi:hypothetical protein
MASRLLDLFAQVVIRIKVKHVCYQIQSILVIWYLGVESSKVEAVSQILFVDLAKIFVPTGRDKLFSPIS